MQDFHKLKVWQKSHHLTLSIYKVTSGFPKTETYGLTSQVRRAASSIPTNLAEGCGRGSNAELRRFAFISLGSASELEYLLQLAYDLEILGRSDYKDLNDQIIEIKKMLTSFISKLAN